MMTLRDGWIDQLNIDPKHTGQGRGSRLVAHAKLLCPAGIDLWTFFRATPQLVSSTRPTGFARWRDHRKQRVGRSRRSVPLGRLSLDAPERRIGAPYSSISATTPAGSTSIMPT